MKRIVPRLIGMYLNMLAWLAPEAAGRKGFYLFCTPLPAPVKDYHREFLDTAEKSSFEHEGITIQTYRWGQGAKKILFLHGWQSHSFRWKNYIQSFSKEEYTLCALDAPAHGLSGGKYINLPLYSRVIDHFILNNQPLHAVISHSFGSFALLYAIWQSPTLPVERGVIMGTPGEAEDFMMFYQQVRGLSSRTMKTVRDYFEKKLGRAPSFFSASQFATAVLVPGLIIHDEKDEDASYQYAVEIHKAWRNSKLITTYGLGHNLKSIDVIRQVVEFTAAVKKISNYQ